MYNSGSGLLANPMLPPKLYRVEDLDRLRVTSFKKGQLPSMVTPISYEIDVSAEPLSDGEADNAKFQRGSGRARDWGEAGSMQATPSS